MKNFVWWIFGGLVIVSLFGGEDSPPIARDNVQYTEPSVPVSQSNTNTQRRTVPTVAPDVSTYLFVTGSRVNQRKGPSTDFATIGQMNLGARVRLVQSSNG